MGQQQCWPILVTAKWWAMNILDDAQGVRVDSVGSRVMLTIESEKAGRPATIMSPTLAIKVGQALIKRAHQVIEFNRQAFNTQVD